MNIDINMAELILKIVLFLCLLAMFGVLTKYVKDYHIFQLLVAKIKGDVYEYDRVRRIQMKKDIESNRGILNSSVSEKKIPLVSKIYRRIEMTGITNKFPAFSELSFIILVFLVGIVLAIVMKFMTSWLVALIFLGAYLFLIWYALGIVVYNRKLNVDSQLLQFTNSAASASRQYSNVIDIIGAIYDQFEGPFREALEACYVEAKTTNDSETAFTHLKQKFDSTQLSFVIDNFTMCSASTGDYYTVATDLSKTVSIYSTSHEKKATTLRNAKINISVMFVIAMIIIYSLGSFFENGLSAILGTPIGNILCIILVLIYIFGMSIRAD